MLAGAAAGVTVEVRVPVFAVALAVDVVVVVDCCAGCCAVAFVVCWFFVSGFLFANFVSRRRRDIPTSRTVPGGSLSRSSSFESEKA